MIKAHHKFRMEIQTIYYGFVMRIYEALKLSIDAEVIHNESDSEENIQTVPQLASAYNPALNPTVFI